MIFQFVSATTVTVWAHDIKFLLFTPYFDLHVQIYVNHLRLITVTVWEDLQEWLMQEIVMMEPVENYSLLDMYFFWFIKQ